MTDPTQPPAPGYGQEQPPGYAQQPPGYAQQQPPVALTDPRQLPAHLRPELPIEERDYFAFWRAPRFRWWKPLLALVMAGFLFLVATVVLSLVGMTLDRVDLMDVASTGTVRVGPGVFLANNVALALCIPIAMVTQWVCLQQRPRWLSSVEGGLRWRWMLLIGLAILPLWILLIGGGMLVEPPQDVRWRDYSALMIAGILLTTPLQAAGEEYLIRGLLGRIVASWFGAPIVGFVASTIVTAGVFMALHGAGDPWLNAYYVAFALAGSWLTWRTGGLEAAIAIHVVNNLLSMVVVPFTDFSDMFDRQAGVADATILINVGVLAVAVALVEFLARRRRPVALTAPGRAHWQALSTPPPASGWGAGRV